MNILTKITGKNLKSNPVRTLVTIIGIVISTAMFTAMTSFTMSLYSYLMKTVIYNDGAYHLGNNSCTISEYETVVNDKRVDEVGLSKSLGYAVIGSTNDYKPYVYVEAMDEKMMELLPIHLTAGRMPLNENEILIPNHLYSNGEVATKLNDKLTLNIGKRYALDEEGNPDKSYAYYQNTMFMGEDVDTGDRISVVSHETLLDTQPRTYTIVGYYERPDFENYTAPGYTAITCLEKGYKAAEEDVFNVRYTLNKKYIGDAWGIADELGADKVNSSVLNYSGGFKYNNLQQLFGVLMAIFAIIIMVGSVSMIYSAFSISVSERTKQFGLLASLGATKKQIRHSVIVEAMMVSAVGIPVGIVCGLVGIGITLHFVGEKFHSIISSPYSVNLVVNSWEIIAAALIALITVVISAWIPSRRATRISAISAIRQSSDVKRESSKLLINRKYTLTRKIFGVPGMLARKYFARSRRKYRVTIFSMSMSIILFIVTGSYCAYLQGFVDTNVNYYKYDYSYDYYGDNPDAVLEALTQAKGVDNLLYYSLDNSAYYQLDANESNSSEEYIRNNEKFISIYADSHSHYERSLYCHVVFINDDAFLDYCEKLGYRTEGLDLSTVGGILRNRIDYVLYYEDEDDNYIRENVSTTVFKDDTSFIEVKPTEVDENVPNPFLVWKLTDSPLEFFDFSSLTLIYPASSALNEHSEGYNNAEFLFKSKEGMHQEMIDDINRILSKNGYDTAEDLFWDADANRKDDQNILIIINVFSYGFITLMALICVANVFNTISTNIALRRKDFAMLRSMGLSQKGITTMMVYECLLYGTRAVVFGLPVATAFAYLIYMMYGRSSQFGFYIPVYSIVIAVVGAFVMVAISMMYATSKIRRNNVIDELKSETT